MSGHRSAAVGLLTSFAIAGGVLAHARQQGQGQVPTPFPLANSLRERGSSITGAFEGWYYNKDGSVSLLVGYFNRNTKQELDIPVGPNNRIEPGGPDQGQPTHFLTSRQFGVFSITVPKGFGTKELTWTIVANGQTNTITLHTKPDWIVEPFENPANKNTPPSVRFQPSGPTHAGPPNGVAAAYATEVAVPLTLTAWAADEGPTINVPDAAQNRGRGRGNLPAPPLSLAWSLFRGPAPVKVDPVKPPIDKENGGKATTSATFSAPGEYILRLQANDQTGDGGGGFQCCWTNAYVIVSVKPSRTTVP
jgi:hypothetical protein